ncbi:MAG: 50S ribosomal protein L11 methyltransferase [Sulfuritalea sp.]|nr:50S ribosomal protein L11 methyltransferase [Sulfuritalea sp.]
MTEGVFCCLIDEERTIAFKSAIEKAVRPGDIVVDAGSGTGVLAMFAADAGAKKVYALELDENNTRVLQGIFTDNGYGDRIEVIQGDATTMTLPENVDVIVCEMIATGLIEELQVPVMNNMLRQVNPGYRVVLEQYHCHAELVHQQNMYYGKKFDLLRYEYPENASLQSTLLSNRVTYRRADFSEPVSDNRIAARLEFIVHESGEVNGLRLSATTLFQGGGGALSTRHPIASRSSCLSKGLQ